MSWQCTAWSLSGVDCPSSTCRLVLFALAHRCRGVSNCAWATVQSLARQVCKSKRTVQRSLRKLEECGLIRKGDQGLAAYDRFGNFVPEFYRPTVWELCIDPSFRLPSQADRSGEAVSATAAVEGAASGSVCPAATSAVTAVDLASLDRSSKSVESSEFVECGVVAAAQASGAAEDGMRVDVASSAVGRGDKSVMGGGDKSVTPNINKNNINNTSPLYSPQGENSSRRKAQTQPVDADVQQVITRLSDLRSSAGLSMSKSRRDAVKVRQLLDRVALEKVLDMLDWVYTKQSSRWWVKRTRTAAAFVKVYDELCDARMLDAPRAKCGASSRASVAWQAQADAAQQRKIKAESLLNNAGVDRIVKMRCCEMLIKLLENGVDDQLALTQSVEQAQQALSREFQEKQDNCMSRMYVALQRKLMGKIYGCESFVELMRQGLYRDAMAAVEKHVNRTQFFQWVTQHSRLSLEELSNSEHTSDREILLQQFADQFRLQPVNA